MLVLTRSPAESVCIRDRETRQTVAVVKLVQLIGGKVRLGIEAPERFEILRSELLPEEKPAIVKCRHCHVVLYDDAAEDGVCGDCELIEVTRKAF